MKTPKQFFISLIRKYKMKNAWKQHPSCNWIYIHPKYGWSWPDSIYGPRPGQIVSKE